MRMVCVSKEFPDEQMQRLVTHEVSHFFQFSLWKLAKESPIRLSVNGSRFLTFLFEGISQHVSGLHRTQPDASLFLRYLVLNGGLRYINIKDWTHPALSGAYEICYILAGYFYDYIKETYGPVTFQNFVKEFRKAKPTAQGFEKAVTQVLKTDFVELDRGFRKYLEDQYKHFPIEKKEAWEYGRDILVQRWLSKPKWSKEKPENVYEPVISPSGDLIAGFIVKGDSVKIALISRKDGTIAEELTGGHSLYKYGLWPIVDLDGPGRALSFSSNGEYVLYFAQTAGRNPELILISFAYKETTKKKAAVRNHDIHAPVTVTVPELTLSNKKIRKIEIPLDDPESPEMSKDGKTVIFSAMQNGQRDIFALNLVTKEVINLTDDKQFDYGPSFSPDEKSLVYVADISGYKKLFALNLETLEKKQLTFGQSNEIRPIYSCDGKTVWFISDADKDRTRNIYTLDIENNTVVQWTDVINGVRTVSPFEDKTLFPLLPFNLVYGTRIKVPITENKLLFGAVGYRDSQHFFGDNLYEMNLNHGKPVAVVDNLAVEDQNTQEQEKPQLDIPDIDPKTIKKYSTQFYLAQANFYGGLDTRYGLYGFGSVYVTDLTYTKHIQANIFTLGEYYKYNTISYFNISKRLWWGVVASFEDHYFYPWFVDMGYNPYGEPAMDSVLYYLRFKRTKLDLIAQYPLDLCHRLEFATSGTSVKYTSYIDWQGMVDGITAEIDNPVYYLNWWYFNGGTLEEYIQLLESEKEYYELRRDFLKKYINDGRFATFTISFVRDTALYKQFGAFTNDMYRFDLSWSTGGHNATISGEARKYLRLGSQSAFAFRGYAGAQFGKTINPWLIGDLGELRGYEWMQFMGNRIWMTNFELRFPLTKNFNLLGMYLGDIRAALFMDLAKIWFDDKRFNALNVDDVNSGLIKGSVGIDVSMPFTLWIFGSELHLAVSKRMTTVKFLPKLEDKWQLKLYFGYSF